MWTAAILAGGQVRRLGGRHKSALRVGADSILDRQLAVLRTLTPHILIVARHRPAPPSPRLPPSLKLRRTAEALAEAGRRAGTGMDVHVVEDRVAGAGALGGSTRR